MNNLALSIEAFESLPLSPSLVAELRSDHAGEAGAVQIYRGILAITRDRTVEEFAQSHLRGELRHLAFFEQWLPKRHRSSLLPVWQAAGWLLGAGSALFGRAAVFHTIVAVETFVERHYLDQIERMRDEPELARLSGVLHEFCRDEVHHRDDAHSRVAVPDGLLARCWAYFVTQGSMLGVWIARRV